jgi:hypothetical protein
LLDIELAVVQGLSRCSRLSGGGSCPPERRALSGRRKGHIGLRACLAIYSAARRGTRTPPLAHSSMIRSVASAVVNSWRRRVISRMALRSTRSCSSICNCSARRSDSIACDPSYGSTEMLAGAASRRSLRARLRDQGSIWMSNSTPSRVRCDETALLRSRMECNASSRRAAVRSNSCSNLASSSARARIRISVISRCRLSGSFTAQSGSEILRASN